ncbi:hypothetical protein DOTSEDRAFT_73158 [Lecanosticta acicola]|uniref:RRM domain-containing protein n=1 Tax=Lecanosticta acicola TaxID=111012 RepID=A0AAI9EDI5_9PEZI|nr:hypothetical protein DOTSEDRAFT_73158 [Lecanosticta acicola]
MARRKEGGKAHDSENNSGGDSDSAHHANDSAETPVSYDPSTYATDGDARQYQQYQQHLQYYQQNQQYSQMDYNQYANSAAYGAGYGYGAPPGYQQYAQPQQQYQASPPQIRNPFAPPPPPASTYASQNAEFDPTYEQQIAQWQSAYAPADQQDRGKKGGKNDRADNANFAPIGQRAGAVAAESADGKSKSAVEDSKYTVVRKGGGESWEDKSLLEWDPKQFRIMVGNLAGEVTDDSLAKAFAQYGVSKARVVRDKRTTKSKGYGFVAFEDHDQGFKAAREMVGKYIGSHPVTIQRSKTNVQPIVKKDQHKHKGKNKSNNHQQNKNKVDKKQQDPLRANTNAGIEKKNPKYPSGLKLLG